MVNSKNKNLLGAIVVIALIVAVIVLTTIASASAKTYAEVETADYYKVKIGDTVWATVESEEDAQKIIEVVKNYYVDHNFALKSIKMDKEIEIEKCTYEVGTDAAPEFDTDMVEIGKTIAMGKVTKETYTVKAGDT